MNEKQVVPNALGIVLGNMQCDRSDKQLLTKVKDLLSVLIRSNLCLRGSPCSRSPALSQPHATGPLASGQPHDHLLDHPTVVKAVTSAACKLSTLHQLSQCSAAVSREKALGCTVADNSDLRFQTRC